jgi:hypothetical protein
MVNKIYTAGGENSPKRKRHPRATNLKNVVRP